MQGVLDAAWAHLLPAFGASGTSDRAVGADEALAKRLSKLRLPAHASAVGAGGSSGTVVMTPEEEVREAQSSLRQVRVANGSVSLNEDTLSVEFPLTDGEWHVTDSPVPVATSGGWTGPETLDIDVIFLETPHRLTLTCSLAKRTFRARWNTQPLRPVASMSLLRAPGAGG